jgi:biopolymer transport protein ExbB/TolQ
MALGAGDTQTLSQSLLTAFDTTSLGLIVAAFAMIVSAVRSRWYKDYMVSFDAAMECVLEIEKQKFAQGCTVLTAEDDPAAAAEELAGEQA